VEELKQPLRACLSGKSSREELVVTATNRRGREFQCRVVCMPLGSQSDGEVSGVIVMMEPVDRR
jgi:two-component system CheB/CheR fusion protein